MSVEKTIAVRDPKAKDMKSKDKCWSTTASLTHGMMSSKDSVLFHCEYILAIFR